MQKEIEKMANRYQKQLYDARSNYRKWLKKLESQGYVINEELKELPAIPKKITPGSVRRVKALTEKLKQTSVRLEFDEKHPEGKLRNYDQSRNVSRARKRIYKRALEKEEQLRRKQQKEQQWYEDTAPERETPDYSDIPDYSDPNSIPEEPFDRGNKIEDPFEIRSYIDFVFDKFMDDILNMQEELESRGLSKKKKESMNNAVRELIQWAARTKQADTETGYKFAKAVEKSKYNGTYITESDLYHKDTAREWIMNIESELDGIELPNIVKDSLDDISDANANTGYSDYSSDDADDLFDWDDGQDDLYDF